MATKSYQHLHVMLDHRLGETHNQLCQCSGEILPTPPFLNIHLPRDLMISFGHSHEKHWGPTCDSSSPKELDTQSSSPSWPPGIKVRHWTWTWVLAAVWNTSQWLPGWECLPKPLSHSLPDNHSNFNFEGMSALGAKTTFTFLTVPRVETGQDQWNWCGSKAVATCLAQNTEQKTAAASHLEGFTSVDAGSLITPLYHRQTFPLPAACRTGS